MSTMSEWAKREVELACKKEKENAPDDEWDYGCACYESALKAFSSLMGDGHSGMSIGFTKNILNQLIDGRPLTPIEDTDDVWAKDEFYGEREDGSISYQCNRMSSLFKRVFPDGTVKYSDVDYCYCVEPSDPTIAWSNSFIGQMIEELYPITMPYMPSPKRIKVVVASFLFDKANGDYDTMEVIQCELPSGEVVRIDKCFKCTDDGFIEIDAKEFDERFKNKVEVDFR